MGDYVRNRSAPRRYTYYSNDYLLNAGSSVSAAADINMVCDYESLPTSLTINSITETPDFLFYGSGANTTVWTAEVGANATAAGAGVITLGRFGPLTGTNNQVVGVGRSYFDCDTATVGDMGQKDFVIEAVLMNAVNNNANFPINKRNLSGGWRIGAYGGGPGIYFQVNDDAAHSVLARSGLGDVPIGTWVHLIAFADYDGILRVYSNGIKGTTTGNMTTITGNVTDATKAIRIGTGASGYEGACAYLAGWSRADWLDADNWDDIAYNRFRRLCGYYHADVDTYNIVDGSVDSTTDVYDGTNRNLVFLADNWVPTRKTSTNLSVTHAQPALDNQLEGHPETLGTGWTATRCSVVADDTNSPAFQWLADGLATDSGAQASAYISDAAATNNSNCVASFWAKKGSTDWCAVDVEWSSTAHLCYFDLDNGVVGTTDVALTTRIEGWGNGWHRCFIHYDGSAATTFYIGPCDADNSQASTGDGSTSNIYLFGLNVINGCVDFNPAYVRAANTSRTADAAVLTFASDVITDTVGSLTFTTHSHATDTALGEIPIVTLNDGGSSAEQVKMSLQSGDKVQVDTATSGGSAGQADSPVDAMDGTDKNVKCRFVTNGTQVIVEGQAGIVDADSDPPDDLDTVTLGTRLANLRIYNDSMG